ncbi:hypothetical protein ACFQU7_08795 [Pseudoroseomonas wenyumeiae]
MSKFEIESKSAAAVRLMNGRRADPDGRLRRELADALARWETATAAGRWEEAAVCGERSDALARILHGR